VLEYAADYYPFGSILREWSNCEKSRFLFTYKERDAETGWDNLGARLYDSYVCRFLGVDPLAEKYPGLSPLARGCQKQPLKPKTKHAGAGARFKSRAAYQSGSNPTGTVQSGKTRRINGTRWNLAPAGVGGNLLMG